MSDVVNKTAKDMFDREIRLGDICVYCVRRGAKMWQNRMTVSKISHNPLGEPKLSGQKQDGYPVNVTSLDRVVIVGRDNVIPYME
jgi:hypothetical protein